MANPCDQLEDYVAATDSVFDCGLTSLLASTALATSLLFSAESLLCVSTAEAQSYLIAPIENDAISTAAGSSVLTDRLTGFNTESTTAVASSHVYAAYGVWVVDSITASSSLISTRSNDCVDTVIAGDTVLHGAVRAPVWVNEAITAVSSLTTNNPDSTALATAEATSSADATAVVMSLAVSAADATSVVADDYAPGIDAVATAHAVSSVIDTNTAFDTAVATARASSLFLLPGSTRAWVANLESRAMWRYDDFAPRWLAVVGGATLGLAEGGLYVIDPAATVAWHIETGWSDLGAQHKKRVLYTYVGGEYPDNTRLEVGIDMAPTYFGYALSGKRATVGKGLNARYWRFRVSGAGAGSLLDIRSDIAQSTRRI